VGAGDFDVVHAVPSTVAGVGDVDLLAAGRASTCSVDADKRVFCWGAADRGQLATGDFAPDRASATEAVAAPGFTVLALGAAFGCGLDADGSLWCWGAGDGGQLGISTASDLPAPSVVGEDAWLHVGAGDRHACAARIGDGGLFCWGANERAQLGLGRRGITSGRNTPTLVDSDRSWGFVTAGTVHTCALSDGDLLWCWGGNAEGQLGTGDVIDRRWPSAIGRGYVAVDAGDRHTCAVTASSTILCWGAGGEGRLGTGDETRRIEPSIVFGAEPRWRSVSAGGRHTCAVQRRGALYCWGSGADGQLGVGETGIAVAPARVCFP
jgi:alpha-tubulin suppressor-like RCC1 family protein